MFQPQPTPFAPSSLFAPSPSPCLSLPGAFPRAPSITATSTGTGPGTCCTSPSGGTCTCTCTCTTSASTAPTSTFEYINTTTDSNSNTLVSSSTSPDSASATGPAIPPSSQSSSLSIYGIGAPSIPFGSYFAPASGGGGAGIGIGIGAGVGAGPGARAGAGPGLGPRSGQQRYSARADGALPNAPPQLWKRRVAEPSAKSPSPLSRRPQRQQQSRAGSRLRHSPAPDMDDQQDPHGMAAQQAAAKDYQPDLPNYLVGNKTPSEAITQEYAKADQTYVEKTIALPQQYSHYRPVQGDGNCGWRAIGFSYFEKLVDTGNATTIENEATRLLSMNSMLGTVGGYDYYEDWAEEFADSLREVARNIGNPQVAHDLVHQKWNNVEATSGMIYYLRLLAATYLKSNAERYDPFIADSAGVHGYCSQSIEIINREIEHLGIVALVDVLLKPINFVLEIAYLDRSPGSQVNTYRFPEEANNQDAMSLGPLIHLLYRPDHYDILYRPQPSPVVNAPAQPVNIQVHRVGGFSDNAGIASTQSDLGAFSTVNFDTLAMIPGFGGAGMPLSPQSAGAPTTGAFPPAQQGWAQPFDMSDSSPQPTSQPPVVAPAPPLSPHSPIDPRAGMGSQPGMGPGPECTIRFSAMQLEYDGSQGNYPEPTFQVKTSTFKNSVWNRAHFGNPDFHPEEWSPEDENVDGRTGAKRRGSRRD